MNVGYACINNSIGCSSAKTFRLSSYSEERLISTVSANLSCLSKILQFNVAHNIYFFRISSDLIPFASHPVMSVNWQEHFDEQFAQIGEYIRLHNLRVSLHPDQFVLLNSPTEDIFQSSVRELVYQEQVLSLLGCDSTHKLQIHVGGVYGDKAASMKRFVERYKLLPEIVQSRLVIENDDRLYSLQDCLQLYQEVGVPVLFDVFHHALLHNGEAVEDAFGLFVKTWGEKDGLPIIDYSSQEEGMRVGRHSDSIDVEEFNLFLASVSNFDFDIMLEIKDKEKSALKVVEQLKLLGKLR